jgi:hypothetical protein
MTNESLLSCPFCNCSVITIINVNAKQFDSYTMCCNNKECKAQLPEYFNYEDAIKAWNKRASQDCDRCARIEKWTDNVGMTPNKSKRYEELLKFARRMTDIGDLCCTKDVEEMAEKLLKEIGELK